MGGRPRQPAALLEMKGAYKKNANRRRVEPKTKGALGEPPAHFMTPSGEMNKYPEIWVELAGQVPVGVATFSDRASFAALVKLEAEMRRPGIPKPALIAAHDRLCTRFAMNPQGRANAGSGSRLPDEVKDEFAEFMGRGKKVG